MKKLICLAAVLLICFSLAAPVLAAEDIFVPSITYKNGPAVGGASFGGDLTGDSQTAPDGQPDSAPDYGDVGGCVVVTSIIQAKERTTDIYEEDRQLLLDVYEELTEGTMELSGDAPTQSGGEQDAEEPAGFKKLILAIQRLFGKEVAKKDGIQVDSDGTMRLTFDDNDYVIKELVDVSFVRSDCVEAQHLHKETLEKEGIRIDADFDLGVAPDEKVVVLHYHDGKWEPITKVVNNGDGTLTCTFEHFCPVAFCVETVEAAETPQGGSIFIWVIIMLLALAALIFLVIRRKKVTAA